MSLVETIISDLTAAMKSQDAARTSTLRMVKAAMMKAAGWPVARAVRLAK